MKFVILAVLKATKYLVICPTGEKIPSDGITGLSYTYHLVKPSLEEEVKSLPALPPAIF